MQVPDRADPEPPRPTPSTLERVVLRLRAAGCVFAEEEAGLLVAAAAAGPGDPADPAGPADRLGALVARRAAGEPLEYVLGWAEFRGLRVTVDAGVFVPRRRTTLLVDEAVPLTRPGATVVDLCCGSGALGAALALAVPGIAVHAVDVDPAAVACAARNLARFGGLAHRGDLFAALPGPLRGRVDVLLVNPPYVPTTAIATMPPEARDHEARVALDGGPDGLDVLRRVLAEAPRWLAPSGHLICELGRSQLRAATAAASAAGLVARVVRDDEVDGTALVATAPPSAGSGRPGCQ